VQFLHLPHLCPAHNYSLQGSLSHGTFQNFSQLRKNVERYYFMFTWACYSRLILTRLEFWKILVKIHIKFHKNYSSRCQAVPCTVTLRSKWSLYTTPQMCLKTRGLETSDSVSAMVKYHNQETSNAWKDPPTYDTRIVFPQKSAKNKLPQ